MLFDMKDRPALNRLVKLAVICQNYEHFEKVVLDHPSWFLRNSDMRKWTKVTLKSFYGMRKKCLKGWYGKSMKKIDKFYKCNCYAEGITKTIWEDEKMVVLDIWTMGLNNVARMTWTERVKEIWRVLIQGRSHLAEVILDYNTAHELAEDIKREVEGVAYTR